MTKLLAFFVGLLLASTSIANAATHSRETNFLSLQASAAQIQVVLDEASVLAHKEVDPLLGNSINDISIWHPLTEEVQLKSGDQTTTIPGHLLSLAGERMPDKTDELIYRFSVNYPPSVQRHPITEVSIWLTDYERSLTVKGDDLAEVDAISSAVGDHLSRLTAWFGGMYAKTILIVVGFLFGSLGLTSAVAIFLVSDKGERMQTIRVFVLCFVVLVVCYVLYYVGVAAGFAMYSGDPSLAVRYAPEIGLAGLIFPVVCAIWPYLLTPGKSG